MLYWGMKVLYYIVLTLLESFYVLKYDCILIFFLFFVCLSFKIGYIFIFLVFRNVINVCYFRVVVIILDNFIVLSKFYNIIINMNYYVS